MGGPPGWPGGNCGLIPGTGGLTPGEGISEPGNACCPGLCCWETCTETGGGAPGTDPGAGPCGLMPGFPYETAVGDGVSVPLGGTPGPYGGCGNVPGMYWFPGGIAALGDLCIGNAVGGVCPGL